MSGETRRHRLRKFLFGGKDKKKEPVVFKSNIMRGGGTLQCPRCRRMVADTSRGRTAHKQSCVYIPEHRPKGWGVKMGDKR